MELGYQKVWVADIACMVKDYETKLFAKVLDQTDTSALLAIDDDYLELVIGHRPAQSTVCIQFTTETAFRHVCGHLKVDMKIVQQENQNSFQAGYSDAEGNAVKLCFHQVYIPVGLGAEIQ